MLHPPPATTFLLSADVPDLPSVFLTRILSDEGLAPLLPDDARLSTWLARQRRLRWSLLWTIGNVKAGQVPTGAGGGSKVNHFMTSYHLTHKARLLEHLDRQRQRLASTVSPLSLELSPRGWLLPLMQEQLAILLPPPDASSSSADGEPALAMVLKPTNASRGDGFRLVTTWTEVLPFNRDGYMLQRYVDPPDLLDGYKYHVRLYLLITALDPPRAYLHRDGYAKKAMHPYRTATVAGGPLATETCYGIHVTNHRPGNTYPEDPYLHTDALWAHFAARSVPPARLPSHRARGPAPADFCPTGATFPHTTQGRRRAGRAGGPAAGAGADGGRRGGSHARRCAAHLHRGPQL